VLWDTTTLSWVLPLRDPETSALLGWQEKGTDSRHFMNRPPGLKKASTLFGYSQLREDIAYVVESPLDCAHMMSEGFPGAVAVCGSTISEDQIKLLRSVDRVIAAFDNPKIDTAGKKASDDMSKLCLKYGINLTFFNYGDSGKKDPGDLTAEELAWGIENCRSFLYGESAYV
jgi:DNA primase